MIEMVLSDEIMHQDSLVPTLMAIRKILNLPPDENYIITDGGIVTSSDGHCVLTIPRGARLPPENELRQWKKHKVNYAAHTDYP